MPTSVGGRAKISQPPPESTESKPSTSLKKARSASGSRLKIIAWAPEMSALMASVYCEARPVFTVPRQQPSRAPADEKPVDFDRVPSLGEHDRPGEPRGRFGGAQHEAGEAVEAAHQESAQVRHEGADARLVGKPFQAELVGLHERVLDEIRVAALEPPDGFSPVTGACGVDAEEGGKHGPANVLPSPAEIEVDGGSLELRLDGIVHREDAGQRFRRRCCGAVLLRRIAVVIADVASSVIDRHMNCIGDSIPPWSVGAGQPTGEARLPRGTGGRGTRAARRCVRRP